MENRQALAALILGIFLCAGLFGAGWFVRGAANDVKRYERTVTVKGLSEREYPADVVIWPIQFSAASNDLADLYQTVEADTAKVQDFLAEHGIDSAEITASAPLITDKFAQQYGGNAGAQFRFTASRAVTVYSLNVDAVRDVMTRLPALGRQGVVLTGQDYSAQTEYLFTRLNDIKPAMIEEATVKAREVAQKFAEDSQSRLGKIRRASQGQFSIQPRDTNTKHIKKIRVVSTVEYYLSD